MSGTETFVPLTQVQHTSPSPSSSPSSELSSSESEGNKEVQAASGRAGRRVRKGPISRAVEMEALQAAKKSNKLKRV